MLLLLLRGRRELLQLRLRRRHLVRVRRPLRPLLLRLRRLRLLRLLLELRLLQGRRRLMLLRLRWQRPEGRLRRLLLLRLPRRLLHMLPLLLPGEVRARVGSRSDCGGIVAEQWHGAASRMLSGQSRVKAVLQVLRLLKRCTLAVLTSRRGQGDLEHG